MLRPSANPGSLRLPHIAWLSLLAVLLSFTLGCSKADTSDKEPSPAETMKAVKQTLDTTSGVQIDLSTIDLPDGVQGVVSASGVGTHEPAFEGTITVALLGATFDVPVVSVGKTVWAKVPLTIGWSDIDPAEYGAPDPANLISTDHGFSSLLTTTDALAKGDSVRGGKDNKEVLTEYIGKVSGTEMANIIPSASGSFDVVYTVSDTTELRSMAMTGVFYPDAAGMTYSVEFTNYGTTKEIVAP